MLRLLAAGVSNAYIAAALVLSPETVKTSLYRGWPGETASSGRPGAPNRAGSVPDKERR